MGFGKVVLVLSGIGFGIFGVGFLIAPVPMAALVNLEPSHPTAITDVRAIYGGLETGLALLLIAFAARDALVFPGLIVVVATYGGILAGRILGILLDGSVDPTTLTALTVEVAGTVLGVVALTRVRPVP